MATLIILVGNMGSGKSTVATTLHSNNGFVIVSGDGLRYLFSNGKYVYNDRLQSLILDTEFALVDRLLSEGFSVVVDDSKNVSSGYRIAFLEIGRKRSAKTVAIEMAKITKHEAVMRRMYKPHGDPITTEEQKQDAYVYWGEVYDKFNNLYESPEPEEGFDQVDRITS